MYNWTMYAKCTKLPSVLILTKVRHSSREGLLAKILSLVPRGGLSETLSDAIQSLEPSWRGLGLTATTYSPGLLELPETLSPIDVS